MNAIRSRLRFFLIVLAVFAVGATPVAGDDPQPQHGESIQKEPQPVEEQEDSTPHSQKQKKRTAAVGFLALLGIACVGLGLIAIVMLWGRRLRRISRQPLPEAKRGDDLWYLKPKKTTEVKEPEAGEDPNETSSDESSFEQP